MFSVVGEASLSKSQPPQHPSCLRVETKPVVYERDITKQRVNQVIRFIENYKLHIFWVVLYTLILFGIFIQKAYCEYIFIIYESVYSINPLMVYNYILLYILHSDVCLYF